MKEKLYLEQLVTVLPSADVSFDRVVGVKGDGYFHFAEDNFRILGEWKLAHKMIDRNQFSCTFRVNGCMPWSLNDVHFFAVTVLDTDERTEDEKVTNASIYKYTLIFPTRSVGGLPNIRSDDPTAQQFCFYFDRGSLKVGTTKGSLQEADSYLVLVSGDGADRRTLDAEAQATLRGYAARKEVNMGPIVNKFYEELRDKEQKSRVEGKKKQGTNKRKREKESHKDRKEAKK